MEPRSTCFYNAAHRKGYVHPALLLHRRELVPIKSMPAFHLRQVFCESSGHEFARVFQGEKPLGTAGWRETFPQP
ncbi:hypothetical protein NDU88_005962 [Pleurodeles waltl]|uniref:Uncharacterized protein n=1 Tax=Pleurodeles waltl TaxID=8319 RepID=A0AAV7RK69_PLEWA|nr:hypothetical protein NDU88_005962 [Pleurodeles waltl]